MQLSQNSSPSHRITAGGLGMLAAWYFAVGLAALLVASAVVLSIRLLQPITAALSSPAIDKHLELGLAAGFAIGAFAIVAFFVWFRRARFAYLLARHADAADNRTHVPSDAPAPDNVRSYEQVDTPSRKSADTATARDVRPQAKLHDQPHASQEAILYLLNELIIANNELVKLFHIADSLKAHIGMKDWDDSFAQIQDRTSLILQRLQKVLTNFGINANPDYYDPESKK